MKNFLYYILLILFTLPSLCSAQMHDANWMYYSGPINGNTYLWKFDITKDTFFSTPGINEYITSTYSSSTGELLCYSDGNSIYNSENEIIENGDSIQYQPNWNLQQLIYSETGVFSGEFLPWPGKEDSLVIYIYKVHYQNILNSSSDEYHRELWYSLIDMKANNGQGKVISKANVLQDSLYHFVSVQHGNGRDWWVVAYHYYQSQATTYYFGSDGIVESRQAVFPLDHHSAWDVPSPLVVSGQGDWIYKSFPHNDGYLFKFDRCNGNMVYDKVIAIPDTLPPNQPNNIGFRYCVSSPQGKYIYGILHYEKKNENNKIISVHKILQADLSKANSSFQYLSTNDSLAIARPFPQTDPFGKIRFLTQDKNKYDVISTIHRPDNLLDECGLEIPTTSGIPVGFTPFLNPRFPYYRMGKLEGSECDTLISSIPLAHSEQASFKVTPNPASHLITLEISLPNTWLGDARFQIVDAIGREIYQQKIVPNAIHHEIDISALNKGIYFIRLFHSNQILGVERFVKIE